MEIALFWPLLWAQAPAPDPTAVPLLALRRWTTSLTLSSPESLPSHIGLWAWLLGLAAALVVAIGFQGPKRALGQVLDLPGHVRLAALALKRLGRAGRLVAILLGATVVAWTVSQSLRYNSESRKDDIAALLRSKGLQELAFEQGMLAALTPLRDLAGLGDNLVLLVVGATLAFKLSADRWGGDGPFVKGLPGAVPGLTTLVWGGAWLYVLYRLASLLPGPDLNEQGLPLGGCLFVEALIVPGLMVIADGLLLAWVLIELRAADPGAIDADRVDVLGVLVMTPGAMLACLACLPARYLATGAWLALYDVQSLAATGLRVFVNGWGLVVAQAAALPVVGLAGAVAWSRGSVHAGLIGYVRLLRAEGGRLVVAIALAGLVCGGFSALSYLLVLTMPAQPWVLSAADSYAHYATLPIGLVFLSALVELGGRTRPSDGESVDPERAFVHSRLTEPGVRDVIDY
ncbi:MAG: hypothetical protein ABI353_01435 [Isosphaeraceae bacterium]